MRSRAEEKQREGVVGAQRRGRRTVVVKCRDVGAGTTAGLVECDDVVWTW